MPSGQSWFIEKMHALGYDKASREGQCFVVASMAMQAFLANDLPTFQ